MERRVLNLLWRRTTLDRVPEAWFIERVLLGDLGRRVRVVTTERLIDSPFLDDVLVVSLGAEFAGWFAEARRRGHRRLAVLHLGDEHGDADRGFYVQCDVVLRNYWFDAIVHEPNVLWVPNGYAVGVGPAGALIPASARTVPGFFAGAVAMRTLSDERRAMLTAVQQGRLPFRLRFTATTRHRLGPMAYAAALANARFALVPGGNSPETIRLYDALEMGCIPIMLKAPWCYAAGALGGPPFPLLDDWSELPAFYARWGGDDPDRLARLDALQAEVIDWWGTFKRRQQAKLRAAVDRLMGD